MPEHRKRLLRQASVPEEENKNRHVQENTDAVVLVVDEQESPSDAPVHGDERPKYVGWADRG
jgi:hypothetical protein